MLCVKSDRPLDLLTLAVLREVDALFNEMKLSYFCLWRNRAGYLAAACLRH